MFSSEGAAYTQMQYLCRNFSRPHYLFVFNGLQKTVNGWGATLLSNVKKIDAMLVSEAKKAVGRAAPDFIPLLRSEGQLLRHKPVKRL